MFFSLNFIKHTKACQDVNKWCCGRSNAIMWCCDRSRCYQVMLWQVKMSSSDVMAGLNVIKWCHNQVFTIFFSHGREKNNEMKHRFIIQHYSISNCSKGDSDNWKKSWTWNDRQRIKNLLPLSCHMDHLFWCHR